MCVCIHLHCILNPPSGRYTQLILKNSKISAFITYSTSLHGNKKYSRQYLFMYLCTKKRKSDQNHISAEELIVSSLVFGCLSTLILYIYLSLFLSTYLPIELFFYLFIQPSFYVRKISFLLYRLLGAVTNVRVDIFLNSGESF